ncbi:MULTISPECIES: PepSY domain-containing protein [Rhodanobacter]|uniref:PepSY domain-containing protein n=1 Tax=Rhodanobacter TaxID=75309 RepID=UPI00040608FC|nr:MULTISPECIES: PepSY domain-containing protein [Rhodanobacter]TAN16827.1 MAG: PepSY domain-containing protein [Rhodanobacter sp.]UJJ54336.1 PepSY domain-containing protein [Rhodanobacter thiooxydans]
MVHKLAPLALTLALGTLALGISSAAVAQQAMTEPQVQSRLTAQGYTKVHDLKFKDGMWHAEARSANGSRVDLRIDASTGQVYPDEQVSRLSKDDVRAALETQGYTHVHDLDFDDGMWKAKARNPADNPVKLKIDATSGKVVGTY